MKDYKYILFHLPMLQEIFKKPVNGFSDIFDVGIYNVATRQKVNCNNVFIQTLYCYYRGGLTPSLQQWFDGMAQQGFFCFPDKRTVFNESEFVPPSRDKNFLMTSCEYDPKLWQEVLEFYKLRQVKTVLRMKFKIDDIKNTYHKYDQAYNGFKNEPLIMIKTDMMFDFYKYPKTDYEKALFAMYAGIRSIIGNKDFAATTGSMIQCRMFGAKNATALAPILKDKKVKAAHTKYTTAYHYKKMLKELVALGFLKSEIGFNRRTYVSCRLTMKELEDAIITDIENKSLKSKVKQVEQSRLDSIKSLKRRLNNIN
ncbi:MAG: hypothetical protein LUH22_00470 [Bacteroides sp.]|nr:hypothetical protein [Bacteroides sp.]